MAQVHAQRGRRTVEGMDFRDVSILLVDDNTNMRRVVGAILKAAGVRRIYEANNGV